MTELNASIKNIPIPLRMKNLPISPKGFPVPWFVGWLDGIPDFRCIGPGKIRQAHTYKKCWLCGEKLGKHMTFTVGPMCTVNKVSAEPPSHLACASYAAMACPFLTKPNMRRNEKDMPKGAKNPAGIMISRNPGVVAIWTTMEYKLVKDGKGGSLFRFEEPLFVDWYAEGRIATRAEVLASISSGLPLLEREATRDGPEALEELERCYLKSREYLPAA